MFVSSLKASCFPSHRSSSMVQLTIHLSWCSSKCWSIFRVVDLYFPNTNPEHCILTNLLQTSAFSLLIRRAVDVKCYSCSGWWIFSNAWTMLVRKSPESRKDLHSCILSRFLKVLWDISMKKKDAAGREMLFLSEFLTARGKSSLHSVRQLAVFEKKCVVHLGLKFCMQKLSDRQKGFSMLQPE